MEWNIDGDGIVDDNDCDDGINNGQFVPMLRLSENVQETGAEDGDVTLYFSIAGSAAFADWKLVLTVPARMDAFSDVLGTMPLADAASPVGPNSHSGTGDDSTPDVYVWDVKDFWRVPIYVRPNSIGAKPIKWELKRPDGTVFDAAEVDILAVLDLDTDSDNTGTVDRSVAEDEKENVNGGGVGQVGKRIFVNRDDDNQNGKPDVYDSADEFKTKSDNDFAQIKFDAAIDLRDFKGYRLYLIASHGLNIWADAKKTEITADKNDKMAGFGVKDVNDYPPPGASPATDQTHDVYIWWIGPNSTFSEKTFYVEGTDVGRQAVRWQLRAPDGYTILVEDMVEINVEEIVWPSNETDAAATDNPSNWASQNSANWNGFELADGWSISKCLCEIINGDDSDIRTHYPRAKTDTMLGGTPEDIYTAPMGENHGQHPAISTETYENGFVMNVTFEFDGPEYMEAWERYVYSAGNNRESASFFRNSGVYVYDHYEVQIFDTDALLKTLDAADFTTYYVDVDGASRGIRGDVDSGDVWLYHELNQDQTPKYWDRPEPVNSCITGIPYKQGNYTTLAQLRTAAERINATGSNTMIIDVTPDDPDLLEAGITLDVTLNGFGMPSIVLTSKTGNGLYDDVADKFIHLQSHWGSGVKFTSATITPKAPPT